ncbi:structural maintenance of chromosomes protein 2 [Neocloeon triangulifer]|uniref:structural maintenance of chromosomes protein 2 n=1 Tax=Neocloeon triangulifer TaxID=2078957 RepID=UPI00286F86E4|nr:structural maintenance of chromosomes protein 2 [Neocloeon triangulifer]
MYVKSIIIEGFKSYGRRVEIKDFDPSFNAITGLNGTGKSNILDALCFVMGISNLSSVRAHSLEELVYKHGQANVTKASVTVTFDNTNKEQSPCGYEEKDTISITRQVIIGGKNKYLINGITVQNTRVADLFKSVQLNVNNPHFLIMQGKITKVLNMKPKEILSMVEEAAGTRMYKTKKEQSLKTLEKKDQKLVEVNRQVNEELQPKIERLRQEKAQYLELQKCTREIETLSRQDTAHKYYEYQEQKVKLDGDLQNAEKKVSKLEGQVESKAEEYKRLEENLKKLMEAKKSEGESALSALEKELHEAVTHDAKLAAESKSLGEAASSEAKRRQQVLKSMKNDEKLLATKEAQLAGGRDEFSAADAKTKELTDALEAARKRHEAASMGMFVDEEGKATSLQQQFIDAQTTAISATTQESTLSMQITQLKKELAAKKAELKGASGQDITQEKNKLKTLEEKIASLKSKLEKQSGCEEAYEEAKHKQRAVVREVSSLKEQVSEQLRNFPSATFNFPDPCPGFDRSKVKGLICNNVRVKKPEFALAIETVAGGSLYNVLVDNEETAKLLIKSAHERRTYLPLNKLQSSTLPKDRVDAAKNLVGANDVWLAMDLVEFDPQLKPAMQRIFGNTLVCRTQDAAKSLPFNPRVGCTCVSLEGDSFSPSGVMSGGSTDKKSLLLPVLEKSREAREKLKGKQMELANIEEHLRNNEKGMQVKQQLRAELEEAQHSASLCRDSIAKSNRGRLELENQELETQLTEAEEKVKIARETLAKSLSKQKEVEALMKDSKNHAEKQKKQAEKELKELQKQLDKHKQSSEQKMQEFSTMEAEMEQLKTAIETAKEEAKEAAALIEANEAKLEEGRGDLEGAKEAVRELRAKVTQEKDRINAQNKEINSINQTKDKLTKERSDCELELKKLAHAIEKLTEEIKVLEDYMHKLERKNDWIVTDRHLFGQKNGPYDFAAHNVVEEKLASLESRKRALEKRTNSNAQHILAKNEEQLLALLKKRDIVESDRLKLKVVIEALDKKMVEALDVAWQKINTDFGSIFSTLLVGATAKLEPTGRTNKIIDGLEVHVGFNGKWKEGLSELSGGQRSLVALSLVLAMLQFKPAPIYILDEVDAALDPSHTENIGELVQKHFKQSQFIIVSLKDGMFKNANVLFKTKLVDGVSNVDRIMQSRANK